MSERDPFPLSYYPTMTVQELLPMVEHDLELPGVLVTCDRAEAHPKAHPVVKCFTAGCGEDTGDLFEAPSTATVFRRARWLLHPYGVTKSHRGEAKKILLPRSHTYRGVEGGPGRWRTVTLGCVNCPNSVSRAYDLFGEVFDRLAKAGITEITLDGLRSACDRLAAQ